MYITYQEYAHTMQVQLRLIKVYDHAWYYGIEWYSYFHFIPFLVYFFLRNCYSLWNPHSIVHEYIHYFQVKELSFHISITFHSSLFLF